MRLAVLNDIHGNLPALEAVLDDVLRRGLDRIVVGGDVFPGPMPHLVLRRLRDVGIPVDFIYGNGEIAILEHLAGKVPALLPPSYLPLIRWNADQLDRAERELVASWPMTLHLTVPPLGDVLFCHATPRNENEIFTPLTPEDRLIPIFDAANASVVVCGHTHVQFDRRIGRTRVINAGSVGMPFGPAGADWLMLGPDVELRHTPYDLGAAAERIRGSGCPAAEEFATKYVLHPPSTADMLKLYTEHELKP
ncbi:MAG TPA: metallophosphoesterase family protein [Vicinamibacterales bacterium]|nr:metallophosphoesterase family protein [Vicinamibacterales bacterium]